mmetsp:Transcript_44074/g.103465  ORF Transcript_44074/g.103465 Transcript_44074/m.103465 type:complete len:200 (-) Transcript_44074:838-1437(-)
MGLTSGWRRRTSRRAMRAARQPRRRTRTAARATRHKAAARCSCPCAPTAACLCAAPSATARQSAGARYRSRRSSGAPTSASRAASVGLRSCGARRMGGPRRRPFGPSPRCSVSWLSARACTQRPPSFSSCWASSTSRSRRCCRRLRLLQLAPSPAITCLRRFTSQATHPRVRPSRCRSLLRPPRSRSRRASAPSSRTSS